MLLTAERIRRLRARMARRRQFRRDTRPEQAQVRNEPLEPHRKLPDGKSRPSGSV